MNKHHFILVLLLLSVCLLYAQSYKFAVICDTRSDANNSGIEGVNVSAVKAVCSQLKKQNAEFVLAAGDFICGNVSWYQPAPPPSDTQFQTFLNAASSQGIGLPGSGSEIILYPVRGNHECYHDIMSEDEVKAAWMKNIGYTLPKNGPEGEVGFTYSFINNNSLFLGVDEYIHADSTEKSSIGVNQNWINSVLKNYSDTKHVFIFGHTPSFAAHHKDCLGENPSARNTFLRSIYTRSQIYFCGHDHFYARARIPVYNDDNQTIEGYIQQAITPGGAPFLTGNRADNHKWNGEYINKDVIPETYIDNAVGYQLVIVEDDKITVQFIATQDACSYYKDDQGVYHYKYNDDWETWNFSLMDQFSF
jgi:hypothetical protein